MKLSRGLVFAMLVLVSGFMVSVAAADMVKDEVVGKAKKALEDKGIVLVDCEVAYDEVNKAWEEWGTIVESTPNDSNQGYLPHGILEEKKYQAIYFDFLDDAKKDIWVFVDPATGDVLTIYEKK